MGEACRYCNGLGRVVQQWIDPEGREHRRELGCPACGADGKATGNVPASEFGPRKWWQIWRRGSFRAD